MPQCDAITHARMAKLKRNDNTKCWRRYGAIRNLYITSSYKVIQSIWKTVWQYLLKIKICLLCGQSICQREMSTYCSPKRGGRWPGTLSQKMGRWSLSSPALGGTCKSWREKWPGLGRVAVPDSWNTRVREPKDKEVGKILKSAKEPALPRATVRFTFRNCIQRGVRSAVREAP